MHERISRSSIGHGFWPGCWPVFAATSVATLVMALAERHGLGDLSAAILLAACLWAALRAVRFGRLTLRPDGTASSMFENLSERPWRRLRPAHQAGRAERGRRQDRAARGARGAAGGRRLAARGARVHQGGAGRRPPAQAVTKSVTPGQQVVKIVHDELVARASTGEGDPGALKIDNPPAPILMVGLQGGGKTTTTAKLAKRLKEREGKRVLMASLDVNRPAAMEQLAILGQQIGVDTLPIVKGEDPVAIARRAKTQASLGGYDVYMLDTAGRLSIDAELMAQVEAVRDVANPRETLLVVDGLTGQDAVQRRENFDDTIGITGVVLTRMDGDGRGGAALSMRAITGKPIRFVGLGEKMDALETFEPDRIAGRILGMGDIVAWSRRRRKRSRPNRPSA
jgi:signal recognition particle subunit SRP54